MSSLALATVVLAIGLVTAWLGAVLLFPVWTGLVRRAPALARGTLAMSALPLLLGGVVALASILPGDPHLNQVLTCHCGSSMPGWMHLCPVHPASAVGLVPVALGALGLLLPGRLRAWTRLAREPLGLGGSHTLLDLPQPTAVLLGWLRPTLVVDRRLWSALEPAHREALIAHEQAHLVRRDPLVLMALRLLASVGPAPLATGLVRAWLDNAELQADALAARDLGSPLPLAEALVRCARLASQQGLALGWTGGRLEHRIEALLDDRSTSAAAGPDAGVIDALLLGGLCAAGLVATPWLHHQVEHLLNLSL